MPGPDAAEAWRFYPVNGTEESGRRIPISDEWGGFGLYPSRAAAEAVLADPAAHLPWLDDCVESWHALAVPYAHRGEVNWRGTVQSGSAIRVAPDDPGGPIVVLTSAGYNNPGPDEAARIVDFFTRVEQVVDTYRSLDGNLRASVFSGYAVDRHDGCTMSLWANDAAMLAAAYQPGFHRDQIDRHKRLNMADRTAFTRARILSSQGTWNGSDPVADAQ